MKYFVGLDVSLEETAICLVDETGSIVKEARSASEPDALAAALLGFDMPIERIGLEACSLTALLHDELTRAGLPAICIETRQANAAMKTMANKTDRNDARAPGANHADGLVPASSRQEPAMPPLALPSGGAPDDPQRDANHRKCRARDTSRGRD